ncbi:MAG: HAMP domain-containing sensor histidine kinase [Desulfobacteraceae bacterium]|nr:HAMP domain-containing sensor histidine kinase [Desulfobacteraceae bacterium]
MTYLSLYPIWTVDLLGCLAMIVIATKCLAVTYKMYRSDTKNVLSNYLLWLVTALFAFSVSRSFGHILNHIFYFLGYSHIWKELSPVSGAINTITFIAIAAITMFFDRIQAIMDQMSRDRSKIQETSKELLKLNKELEIIVSERTQTEMVLKIAHEARNPVMIIGGLLLKLLKGMPSESGERQIVEKVMEQARRLEAMVSQFEEAFFKTKKHFSSQELNSITEDAIEFVRLAADEREIIILFDRSPANLVFQGNKYLIKVALAHIIRNAIEVCSPGDTIEITTGLMEKWVTVTIKDNGPGIPEDVKAHAFEPFYNTPHGETGLGLPYVKQIIDEHKGEIRLTSSMGKGTTVKIRIPSHIAGLIT